MAGGAGSSPELGGAASAALVGEEAGSGDAVDKEAHRGGARRQRDGAVKAVRLPGGAGQSGGAGGAREEPGREGFSRAQAGRRW